MAARCVALPGQQANSFADPARQHCSRRRNVNGRVSSCASRVAPYAFSVALCGPPLFSVLTLLDDPAARPPPMARPRSRCSQTVGRIARQQAHRDAGEAVKDRRQARQTPFRIKRKKPLLPPRRHATLHCNTFSMRNGRLSAPISQREDIRKAGLFHNWPRLALGRQATAV
jgi:hypothetical protein